MRTASTGTGTSVGAGGSDAGRPSERLAAALQQLRDHGQRVTRARTAVLETLDEVGSSEAHLDAQEIVDLTARTAPGVHRATIYRALATLTELGIITHTHLPGSGTIYHLDPHRGAAHAHLRCRRCGTLIDVPAAELAALADALAERYGFSLEPEHAALLGRCRDCRLSAGEPG